MASSLPPPSPSPLPPCAAPSALNIAAAFAAPSLLPCVSLKLNLTFILPLSPGTSSTVMACSSTPPLPPPSSGTPLPIPNAFKMASCASCNFRFASTKRASDLPPMTMRLISLASSSVGASATNANNPRKASLTFLAVRFPKYSVSSSSVSRRSVGSSSGSSPPVPSSPDSASWRWYSSSASASISAPSCSTRYSGVVMSSRRLSLSRSGDGGSSYSSSSSFSTSFAAPSWRYTGGAAVDEE
mmetsp:Transcript_39520/g.97857  ORF Transcript_39520/g.97857 Transcript_39520/m.97857 type:complete len:242 (-) Transcript_39520:336-1061(-)